MPFIVGVARSGTTLLRLMLDAHPSMSIPAETHFVPAVLRLPRPTTVSSCFDELSRAHTRSDFGDTPAQLRTRLSGTEAIEPAEFLRAFYRTYADSHGTRRWGDKTGQYLTSIPRIAAALPEVVFVHIVRDPRAVAASRRDLHFGPGSSAKAQAEDWRHRIIQGRRAGKALGSRYIEMRYEDLVRDAPGQLTHLCDRIDLVFDPAMVEYHESAADRLGELADRRDGEGRITVDRSDRLEIHQRTSQPPDEARIDQWKQLLSGPEIEEIEAVAGELLDEFGYR